MSVTVKNDLMALPEECLTISTILEASPNAVIAINEHKKVIAFNSKAKEMFGYTHREISDIDDILKLVPPDYQKKHKEALARYYRLLASDNPSTKRVLTVEGRKKNGTIFPIRVNFGAQRYDSHMIIVTTIQDITEEKRMESILKYQQQLTHTAKILSMIAHQWRQPLSSLLMIAHIIKTKIEKGTLDTAELLKQTEQITKISHFLEQTIEDFRYFFVSEHTKPKHTDCATMIQSALDIVRDEFGEEGIALHYKPSNTPIFATYAREVVQAILVIVKNARDELLSRHIDNPGITIDINYDKPYHTIDICDNAGGIRVDPVETVFNLFYTTKNEGKGTGLGLYIAKMIVEQHCRGILSVHNTEQGACFRLQLPDLDTKQY